MSFATPAILFALAALPAIWWLLRLTPPRARSEVFPPARILADISNREETPAHTPWWLILLRLLLAALVILALAGPAIAPPQDDASGDGPLLVVLDTGWDAARDWEARRDAALALVNRAGEDERPIALVATAEGPDQILSPTSAEDVADRIRALKPHPFAPAYDALLPQIETLVDASDFGAAAWFSGGLAHDGADDLAEALAAIDGTVTLYRSADETVQALLPPQNGPDAMTVELVRSRTGLSETGQVLARDLRGRAIAEADFAFAEGEADAVATFDLPQELRNEIVRLEIAGEQAAGAVQLLDERYRRRTVGILTGEAEDQPLLSAEYYLSRAVMPFADPLPTSLELGRSVNDLVGSGASIIILADIGTLPDDAVATLTGWIEDGGTLIRFAGPRFAAADPLLTPVLLRTGGRVIGGTLSWEEPQPLGPFPETSPFFGLAVPGDVTVGQQVLAEPTVALAERTWATLADGTPLVTATDRGEGRIVLFHITADPDWSNLPLSGVFVEMLQRIAILAEAPDTTPDGAEAGTLPPWRVLDGNGRLTEPGDAIEPLPAGSEMVPGIANPPGLYGTEEAFRAFNLIGPEAQLRGIDELPSDGLIVADLPGEDRIDLAPWLFAAAFLLFLLDTGAVMLLGGDRAATRRASAATAAIALALLSLPIQPRDAQAQQDGLTDAEQFALQAATETTLAYVVTGDPQNDAISRAGLTGLSEILRQRTSFEPPNPIGVDIASDELAFFPMIYWRVSPDAPMPTQAAMQRLGAYMRSGGIVLFDTADELERNAAGAVTANTDAGIRLQEMLADLDIPPLEPVPADHVLTQTYYLLSDLPGRHDGGDFWVELLPDPPADGEQRPARPTDDVSPILITSNDLAAAWAINDNGAFMFPLIASNPRQREMAFRAGINIVMYALTGNYKTDQVHIPDLLDRMAR